MSDLKVKSGDALTSELWNGVIDRLPIGSGGMPAGLGNLNRSMVKAKNVSGTDRSVGELLMLDSYTGPDEVYDASQGVAFELDAMTWHTDISRAVVCAEDIPDDEDGFVVVSGVCLVKVPSAVDNPFVMIDPSDTTQGKTSLSGVARCLCLVGTGYVLANWRDESNLWKYEMTEDSLAASDTTCKLLTLDGADFSAGDTIELTDKDSLMDDQVAGDEGYCILVGNKFHAIQANCV